MEIVQQRNARHQHDEEWESWKPFIRAQYLDENKTLTDVLAELRSRGFAVNKGQLEMKTKKWKFHKKLQPDIWRYIGREIKRREQGLKKSLVILSGRRISPAKIHREINRNELVRGLPLPPPNPPPADIPIYICTPRNSTTDLVLRRPWPKDLPWTEFCETYFNELFKGAFIHKAPARISDSRSPESETALAVSKVARHGLSLLPPRQRSRFFSAAFEHIVRKSLSITIGSEDLAMDLFRRKSIDQIAARFDSVLPVIREDENLHRAAVMVSGTHSEILAEMMKIIMYLASNQLITELDDWNPEESKQEQEAFISLCRLAGLTQPSVMARLVKLSQQNATLAAVLDVVFDAAASVLACDIVSILLTVQGALRVDKTIQIWHEYWAERVDTTPLHFAVSQGCFEMITLLLSRGAGTTYPNYDDPLLFAMHQLPLEDYRQLLRLTRHMYPTNRSTHDYGHITALQAALILGQKDLIEAFIETGDELDFNHSLRYNIAERHLLRVSNRMSWIGCLGFAVIPKSRVLNGSATIVSEVVEHEGDEQKALDLCSWLLLNYSHKIVLSPENTSSALILAAALNYPRVISFLQQSAPIIVNRWNGTISPLYAAIEYDCLEACRVLLEIGASTDNRQFEVYISNFSGKESGHYKKPILVPPPLYVAVQYSSNDIVDLLLRHGGSVDQVWDCIHELNSLWSETGWILPSADEYATVLFPYTPFRAATKAQNPQKALYMLEKGAVAMPMDLCNAAKRGDLKLVRKLVQVGLRPSEATVEGISALEIALINNHISVSRFLFEIEPTSRDYYHATFFRFFSVSRIQTLIPSDLLEAPRRMSPGIDNRSYLENAILSEDQSMIDYAFSLDPTFYDSGSLCAAVFLSARKSLPLDEVLNELLRRKEYSFGKSGYDAGLENTALSISLSSESNHLFSLLTRFRGPDMTDKLAMHSRQKDTHKFTAYYSYGQDTFLSRTIEDYVLPPDDVDDILSNFETSLKHHQFSWHQSGIPKHLTGFHGCWIDVSPLLFAVLFENTSAVELLLDLNYKPDIHTLAAAISRSFASSLTKRLILASVSCNIDTEQKDLHSMLGFSLFLAVQKRDFDITRFLLEHNADPKSRIKSTHGFGTWTVIMEAIQWDRLDLVELLISTGAMVDQPMWSPREPFETTPLQLAIEKGHIGMVKLLLDHGADINEHRSVRYGNTALEQAAENGRLDITKLLFDYGVETEGLGRFQFIRAMIIAQERGFSAVQSLLESHGKWPVSWYPKDEIYRLILYRDFIAKEEHSVLEFIELIALFPRSYSFVWWWTHRPMPSSCWERDTLLQVHNWLEAYRHESSNVKAKDLEEAANLAWQIIEASGRNLTCLFSSYRGSSAQENIDWSPATIYILCCPVLETEEGFQEEMDLEIIPKDLATHAGLGKDGVDDAWVAQTIAREVLRVLNDWKSSKKGCCSHQVLTEESRLSMSSDAWSIGSPPNDKIGQETDLNVDQPADSNLFFSAPPNDIEKGLLEELSEDEAEWEERRKLILRDMLGEAEAPFMETDFLV